MATSTEEGERKGQSFPSQDQQQKEDEEGSKYECNVCFDTATDAVVSMCGHLFCWPCIHTWMESRPNDTPTCPVCKSAIDKERLIPIYGRGSSKQQDPRDKVPPRPAGQREEVPPQQEGGYDIFGGNGFNMGGVNVSFGIGGFPFGFGIGPGITLQTGRPTHHHHGNHHYGNNTHRHNTSPQRGERRVHNNNNVQQTEEQRKTMARLMLTFAILFIIMIIFS